MNVFDIILYLALAWAVYNGWRRGFLLQMLSLAAVVAAFYLAVKYGETLGRVVGIGEGAAVAGFLIFFVAALIGICIVVHLMRAVFRFAGLGALDTLLGVIFSVVKILLVVSVLFAGFDALNRRCDMVSPETVEESRWFRPVSELTDKLTPYFEELKNRIDD